MPPSSAIAPPPVEPGLHLTELVSGTVAAPLERLHPWLTNVALEDVLPGSALVPRVVGTEPLGGTWGEVGAARAVRLADGSRAFEAIAANDPPLRFAYTVWVTDGLPARLVRYVRGEFLFTAAAPSATKVEWRYSLRPRSGVATPLVAAYARFGIRPFLASGLAAIIARAEASLAG